MNGETPQRTRRRVVLAAVLTALALAAGTVTGSDAQSPFDLYYVPTFPPAFDFDGPTISSKGAPRSVRLTRSGTFAYPVGPFNERARGRVSFATSRAVAVKRGAAQRRRSFGAKGFVLDPGRKASIRIKLSRTSRTVLRRYRELRVRAAIVARDRFGNETDRTLSFVLKRPR